MIARSTAMGYKGQAVDVKKVAKQLGVNYVVEGSVQREGDSIRINVKLIDGKTGFNLWAQQYDRQVTDIFKVQDAITQKIVDALSVRLTEEEKKRTARRYTVSFDEKWSQYPSNPAEGYVLSLGFGAEEILASVDVFMIYDWDPQFSAFDLASVIDPTADGAVTGPLETVQIGGQSGLMRTYEMVDMGVRIIGSQHILVQGDRAAVIILWAVDSQAEEFAPEFEAIVESFDLLP